MSGRLLLLNTDLEIGGTPTVVRELAKRLRSPGLEVEVACLGALGPVGDAIASAGINVTALHAKSRFDLAVLPRLLSLLERRRFDTVLSFLVHANSMAAAARVWRGGGRWFQSIQTTQPVPGWHWRLQALAARWAEKIIVPSSSVARCAREWSDVPEEKIVVIPNAIDVASYPFDSPAKEMETGKPLRVGFIGRLDPVKRIGDLLWAMTLLETGVQLEIYGEGVERQRIETQIGALQLAGRVTLHGAIAQSREVMTAMDVLVLPSSAEGFGLVLIEAFAAGVPVVATDAPGIRDVVSHRRTGLLVPVGDVPALAAAIRSVGKEPMVWRERTIEARREVEQKYAWDRVMPMYRAVLGVPS